MILLFSRPWEGLGWLDAGIVVIVFGWNFVGSCHAVRVRDYGKAIFHGLAAVAAGGIACYMWAEMADWRPVVVLLPISVATFFVRHRREPPKPEHRHPCFTLSVIIGCNAATLGVLLLVGSVFPMMKTEFFTSLEPNGQYEAVIINLDGMTYGYDILVLRPKSFSIWTALDRPDRVIAEFVQEDKVTGLQWDSDSQLTVKVVHGLERVWGKSEWHGIKIRYLDDPQNGPDDNRQQGPTILKHPESPKSGTHQNAP